MGTTDESALMGEPGAAGPPPPAVGEGGTAAGARGGAAALGPLHAEEPGRRAGFLDLLIERMRRQPLPALQRTAARLRTLPTGEDYNVQDLSRAVMQDPVLTALLLRVVNSVFYRRTHEPITTVTRAILMLGEEQVRRLAVKAACAELATLSPAVRQVARRALLAASQAEALCGAVGIGDCEGVVVGALLANFGELAIAWYLPEQYARVETRIRLEGEDRRTAYQAVLGVPLDQVSCAVGAVCELPEAVQRAWQSDGDQGRLIRLATRFATHLEQTHGELPSEDAIQQTLTDEGWPGPVSAATIRTALQNGLDAAAICITVMGLG
ncbi:HDOD domain-containing protein [Nitrospira sp. Kam-Ns4a]